MSRPLDALLGEEARRPHRAPPGRRAGEALRSALRALLALDGRCVRRFQRGCRRTWAGGCLLSLTSRRMSEDLAAVLLAACAVLLWKWRFVAVVMIMTTLYLCEASRRALRALPPHDAVRGVRCLSGRDLPVGALPRTSLAVGAVCCLGVQSIAVEAHLWWAPVLCWAYLLLLTASRVAAGRAFVHQALLSLALGISLYLPLHTAAVGANRALGTSRARVLASILLLLPPAAVFLHKVESNQSRFAGVQHREFMRVLRRIATSEGRPAAGADPQNSPALPDDVSVGSRFSRDSDADWREARTSTLEFFRRAAQGPPTAARGGVPRGPAVRGRGSGKDSFALLVESMERRAALAAGGPTPSSLRA